LHRLWCWPRRSSHGQDHLGSRPCTLAPRPAPKSTATLTDIESASLLLFLRKARGEVLKKKLHRKFRPSREARARKTRIPRMVLPRYTVKCSPRLEHRRVACAPRHRRTSRPESSVPATRSHKSCLAAFHAHQGRGRGCPDGRGLGEGTGGGDPSGSQLGAHNPPSL
jgi:hypothetical protein